MAQPTQSSPTPHGRLGRQLTMRWSLGLSAALALSLVAAYAITPAVRGSGATAHANAGGMQQVQSTPFKVTPKAHNVAANWSKTVAPRSAAEAKAEQAATAKIDGLQAPKLSMTTQKAVSPASMSRAMSLPAGASSTARGLSSSKLAVPTGPLGDNDYVLEQANASNAAGGPAFPCQFALCSTVAEPSLAANGAHIMMSYNWYDTYSDNGGSSFNYLDPFTEFSAFTGGASFCCDQQVIYEPSRNTMWWEQLYLNGASPTANPGGIGIGTASGTVLNSWCFYYFTGATFGGSNGDILDFPDMAFTNDNMFMTFNRYTSGGAFVASYIVRLDLTPMSSCGSPTGLYTFDSTVFGTALTQGAQGTMWYTSDGFLSGGTTGSQLKICQWQDPQGGPSCVYRNIPAFNYTVSPNCGSQDGVVINWCTRLDSRARSAFFTKANFRGFGPATLGVALTVGPAGSDPFPWVAIYYFEVAGLPYTAGDALFNNGYALAYPSFAPNFRGFIGGDVSYGGGVGTTDFFPSQLLIINDPAAPTPPFAAIAAFSTGNASAWGDYDTVRPMYPSAFPWIGAYWEVDASGNIFIGEAIWSRGRDLNAYLRWANS